MEYLPLEVGSVHRVEIRDSKSSYARSGEIERRRRSKPACADDENLRGHQPSLSLSADLLQQDLPVIALCLFVCHNGSDLLLMVWRGGPVRNWHQNNA